MAKFSHPLSTPTSVLKCSPNCMALSV